MSPLFGILILDRDPFAYANLPGLVQVWLQDAGGFAALGLLAYLAYALRMPADLESSAKYRAGVSGWMLAMTVGAILCYSVYLAVNISNLSHPENPTWADPPKEYKPFDFHKYEPPAFSRRPLALLLMAGGLFALLGVGEPFARSLSKIRFRRIWALSLLGFKEAIRNRLFLVFLLFLVPFLFPVNWFYQDKPEHELRNTIGVTSFFSTMLSLLPAALLAAFAIPNDIKNQNLYTVVTKPVERFEVVAGRFFGYVLLVSLALAGMTAVGLVFITTLTTLDPAAKEETYLARKPVRGKLGFQSRRGDIKGTNVGREFSYREYIGGDPSSSQRAVYSFASLPSALTRAGRPAVPLEFTFDIFRMTKGQENKGVDLEIRVVTPNCPQTPPTQPRDGQWKWADPKQEEAYRADLADELKKLGKRVLMADSPAAPDWAVADRLAEKYGFYEVLGKQVFDYHPDRISVPAGLFRNASKAGPADGLPPVRVYIKCTTPGQMLGMAEGDLYFLETEPKPSPTGFAWNYAKAAVGLWCRVCLVIGLGVCCSTYLAGVISFLVAAFLFLAGSTTEHLQDMASGKSFVGGPARSLNQLLEAKQATMPGDPNSPVTKAADIFDGFFSWVVRRFINMVPDVDAYSWSSFLAEGFDIPVEYLVMNVVVMAGYLLPWFILGFYLMRSREVAE